MADSVITGKLNGAEVRLTVAAPTVLSGIKRQMKRSRVLEELGDEVIAEDSDGAAAMRVLALFWYPDLTSLVTEAEGLDVADLSFMSFCALPDQLVDAWAVAAYDVAPHWRPVGAAEEESEKKDAMVSGSGSASI